jgi:phthalate 4,5-dioxygenase oxygenase subunit
MLTRSENELLTQVGPQTPMGRMMRRYWIPALASADLEPGCDPRRVRLLGEDLVAFRGSDGVVGILDEHCPHRGASLVLGHNDDCALRCLYHGWRIAADGRVLETPPEPDELGFKDRIRATAYPTQEAGGIIWTYMGPPGTAPQRPEFFWTLQPENQRIIMRTREECNWAQCLEGAIDSAHSNYLHANAIVPAAGTQTRTSADQRVLQRPSNDGAPRIFAQNTPYGFRYGAIRTPLEDADRNQYVRVTLFIAPFCAIFPAPEGWAVMQMFVPIDDEHTMFYFIKVCDQVISDEIRNAQIARSGMRPGIDYDAQTFAKIRHRGNTWQQNRAAMRRDESFSGMIGVNNEDIAVQESMGPIYDRTKERLGTSDVGIIRMRRIMLDGVRRFEAGGMPPGQAEPVEWARLAAEERMIPLTTPWQTVGAFAGEPIEAGVE